MSVDEMHQDWPHCVDAIPRDPFLYANMCRYDHLKIFKDRSHLTQVAEPELYLPNNVGDAQATMAALEHQVLHQVEHIRTQMQTVCSERLDLRAFVVGDVMRTAEWADVVPYQHVHVPKTLAHSNSDPDPDPGSLLPVVSRLFI